MLRPFAALALFVLAAAVSPARSAEPLVVPVWPAQPPGETAPVGEEADMTKPTDNLIAGKRLIRLGNVSRPTLTIYRPAKEKDTGAAVVIAPGGGYNILAWDLEGTEVAEWLNTLGVTGIVLKYRVPRRPGQARGENPVGPLQDAQRTMSLVRSKAKEWGLDPTRIGILGFSAGGHLAASASTNYDRRAYDGIDEVDRVSCRPDFTVLIYPGYLSQRDGSGLMPDIRVTKETPPAFLAHAGNDNVSSENSALYYLALKRAGVPAELHVYPTGGHGYGLRRTSEPVTTWPQRCEEWLKMRGLLKREG